MDPCRRVAVVGASAARQGSIVIVTLELTDREAAIFGELRRMAYLTSDADVLRVAVFRLAREFDVEGLHPSDFGLPTRARRNRGGVFHEERSK